MTDDTTTAQETEDAPPAESDTSEDQPDTGRANRQAAKYRTQLRAAETRLAELETALTAYHRSEAERHADAVLETAGDLWQDGLDVNNLLGDDGRIDPDKAAEAARQVAAAHPSWKKRRFTVPGDGGQLGTPATNLTDDEQWHNIIRRP